MDGFGVLCVVWFTAVVMFSLGYYCGFYERQDQRERRDT